MAQETKQIELSNRLFVITFVLMSAIALFYVVGAVTDIMSLPQNAPREITISGEGKVFAAPDVAIVQMGVTNEGTNIAAITDLNSKKMNNILEEVKKLGIEEKDIKTTQYSLTPRYEYPLLSRERIFKGYTITQEIQVKIRNFEKVGDVFSVATQNGANLVGDLYFTIDDQEKVKQEARDKAIAQARAKAESMAKASGLAIGRVLNVQESYRPYYDYNYGGGALMEKAMVSAAPTAPDIQPGQQEVTVNVSITYQVR